VEPIEARRQRVFTESIQEYLKSYHWQTIPKIARNFEVADDWVERELGQLIQAGGLKALISGEKIIMDLSELLSSYREDFLQCPSCGNDTIHGNYCAYCGVRLSDSSSH
jgi:hypothetical protein